MFDFMDMKQSMPLKGKKGKFKVCAVQALTAMLVTTMFVMAPVGAVGTYAASGSNTTTQQVQVSAPYEASATVLGQKANTPQIKAPTANEVNYKIVLDGNAITLSEPILNSQDRTYLPLRALAANLDPEINKTEKRKILE